ncbi:MAG TPA: TlpA disulfide reductase family protein [Mycobacteriales bacterium]|nr:TlpA disulfide reductase family protein [Mycobacteriales bacterium]
MSPAAPRRVPVAALASAALIVLAGCSPGSAHSGHTGTTVAGLRARAAMAPCPKPTSLAAATGGAPSASPTPGAPGVSGASGGSTGLLPPGASPSAEATEPNLPAGAFPCLAGGPDVPLRQLTGVPTVINLWATWCLPCRTELPAFQRAFARADPDRLRVMGVATEDPGLARELSFAADTGLHMPNLVDDKGKIATEIGIRGLPATLFVAADGSLVHVYNGSPLTFSALRDLLRRYLRVTVGG